jgi:hypothetical protein
MRKKTIILLVVGVIVIGLAVWGSIEGREEFSEEKEWEKPIKVAPRVVQQEEGTAVAFDADTQKRADIAVFTAQQITRSGETEELATVLPLQEIIDLRNTYVAAKAQADRAVAFMEASRREYDRIKALHDNERNVSDKVLETTQATWLADEAAARAAREALNTVGRGARQKWGITLVSAVADNAPLFHDLSEQRQVLLRVAAPAGSSIAKPPDMVRLDAGDSTIRTGRLISLSPQVDPRIQGPSFFYAAAIDGLLPGSMLTAYLPTGAERTGSIVPSDAVVWWQGKAWFYAQSAPDRFVRRELAGAMPVESGWFVPGLQAIRVVVRGAQTLLSEELRAQIQVGNEGE